MTENSINTINDYAVWLTELKQRIQSAQQRASLSANRELVLLYWQIGRDILERQDLQGWGAKVIDRLAHDLTTAFPDMKGFSRRNLLYMRSFAEKWPDAEFVQQAVAQIPWGHNILIITKCDSVAIHRQNRSSGRICVIAHPKEVQGDVGLGCPGGQGQF